MGAGWQNGGSGGINPTPNPTPNPDPITPPTPSTPVVFLPSGVDPYYGLTISNLSGSTGNSGGSGGGGNYTPPDKQDFVGNKSYALDDGSKDPAYKQYIRNGGTLPYSEFRAIANINGADTGYSGSSINTGGFQIATPNMTWLNSLPTVMPAGGGTSAAQYGPMPFTREANTPGVTYNPPPLTYNNPYNTNPYLPTSNPFALVPNNTGTAQ